MEAEIGKREELLSDPELFTREPVKFQKATEALAAAEDEWLELEEKAGGVAVFSAKVGKEPKLNLDGRLQFSEASDRRPLVAG